MSGLTSGCRWTGPTAARSSWMPRVAVPGPFDGSCPAGWAAFTPWCGRLRRGRLLTRARTKLDGGPTTPTPRGASGAPGQGSDMAAVGPALPRRRGVRQAAHQCTHLVEVQVDNSLTSRRRRAKLRRQWLVLADPGRHGPSPRSGRARGDATCLLLVDARASPASTFEPCLKFRSHRYKSSNKSHDGAERAGITSGGVSDCSISRSATGAVDHDNHSPAGVFDFLALWGLGGLTRMPNSAGCGQHLTDEDGGIVPSHGDHYADSMDTERCRRRR